ncbi:hypothetical protein CsatB_004296 [Cannabis sativa]
MGCSFGQLGEWEGASNLNLKHLLSHVVVLSHSPLLPFFLSSASCPPPATDGS